MSTSHFLLGLAVLGLLTASCASSAQETRLPSRSAAMTDGMAGDEPAPMAARPGEPNQASAPQSEPAPACEIFAKPGVLHRAALVQMLDAGLARWLQGVEGDRMLANHRFQGWLIKSLHPTDPCYREIDLRPGDIVQKVNGKSVEKPEQAFDVAESLRTAPAIVVDLLRDGKAQRTTISIVEQ